tara:strand:+ start:111175 stop:112158 length:984 start_codon:yes stop_codon:yes gene_type:complete
MELPALSIGTNYTLLNPIIKNNLNIVQSSIQSLGVSSFLVLLIILAWIPDSTRAQNIEINLEEIQTLPIEGLDFNQPSGLFMSNDTLYTVSDKHDNIIFRIDLEPDRAVLVPHVHFDVPGISKYIRLDFEGITRDEVGNYYLISEGAFAILKVEPTGHNTSWMTPNMRWEGEERGLFQARGGFLEGITFLEEGRFLLSAERQPCALIEVVIMQQSPILKINQFGMVESYTGLHREGEYIFILQRDSATIRKTRFPLDAETLPSLWSFRHIVDQPEYIYKNKQYGRKTAEGLAMDDERVYVVLDNNNDVRKMYPDDRRALLLVMQKPK